MTQFEKSAAGTFLSEHGNSRLSRYALMYIGTIVLIGAIAVTAVISRQAEGSPAVEARPPAGEVLDGWMPGITAANRAARIEEAGRTQDGWASALLKPEPEVQDGWSSYLLQEEPEVVDGWASRYLLADDD
jgi:hypothetical protein